MGWDVFGFFVEQYVMDIGNDLVEFIVENIVNFKCQINVFGFLYDWDCEVNIIDFNYYKWIQWIFIKFYEKGLVYEVEVFVNWVEELGMVIVNEEVFLDGILECGGYLVVRKLMC